MFGIIITSILLVLSLWCFGSLFWLHLPWTLYVIANSVCFLVLVQDSVDYQGRSYLHIPQDIDVRLDTDEPPERCYLPKKHIHTWSVKAPSYYFPCYQKDMIIIVIIHSKYFAISDWLQSPV